MSKPDLAAIADNPHVQDAVTLLHSFKITGENFDQLVDAILGDAIRSVNEMLERHRDTTG